jgi:hypothetical protein
MAGSGQWGELRDVMLSTGKQQMASATQGCLPCTTVFGPLQQQVRPCNYCRSCSWKAGAARPPRIVGGGWGSANGRGSAPCFRRVGCSAASGSIRGVANSN